MNKNRTIRITLAAALALALSIAFVYTQKPQPNQPKAQTKKVAGISIGGPYTLTDHTGATRKSEDFAGQYKLIYFGFTYCPVICPTELSKITATLKMLPEETAAKVQPLFITIDPDRDTPDVLKDYISLFHPRFVGLTGTPEQIKTVTSQHRIYASKVQDETLNDYTMDHSSYIYLMSPNDELINLYKTDDSPAQISDDIKELIQ